MVLYVSKFNLPPDKVDEYMQWAPTAMQSVLSAPGIKEVRIYLTVASDNQIVATYEFDKPEDWLAWGMHEKVQKMTLEFFRYALNPRTEIWGPAPNYPDPIRP